MKCLQRSTASRLIWLGFIARYLQPCDKAFTANFCRQAYYLHQGLQCPTQNPFFAYNDGRRCMAVHEAQVLDEMEVQAYRYTSITSNKAVICSRTTRVVFGTPGDDQRWSQGTTRRWPAIYLSQVLHGGRDLSFLSMTTFGRLCCFDLSIAQNFKFFTYCCWFVW